jgi:hypothetical protein
MPQSVKDILQRGYERTSHTILAAVDVPFEGADREYVTALALTRRKYWEISQKCRT